MFFMIRIISEANIIILSLRGMLGHRIKHFLKSDVFKSFTVLFSGTLIAQAIGYAIAPILTRLYTTAEMGEMLYYMRIVSFIASLVTLRYEAVCFVPERY